MSSGSWASLVFSVTEAVHELQGWGLSQFWGYSELPVGFIHW